MSHTIRTSAGARSPARAPRRVRPAPPSRSRRRLIVEPLEARALPSFAPPLLYPGAIVPRAVAVGDFNGDGRLDLAQAEVGPQYSVLRVWLGGGDGTLTGPLVPLQGEGGQPALVSGDFNGDGRLDLAVGRSRSPHGGGVSGVQVLLGRGDGSFEPGRSHDPGTGLHSFVEGDFNVDGQLDLAVTLGFPGDRGGVRVLLGQGDGSFQDGFLYRVDRFTRSGAVGDFNADGWLDLAVTCQQTLPLMPGQVCVLLGNGDGTLQDPVVSSAATGFLYTVKADDFDADGHDDLAVVNYADFPQNDGSVSVLLGRGDGSFQPAVHYPTGRYSQALGVGDFNRDGLPDLAATYRAAGDRDDVLGILLGRGDGTFHDPDPYPTPSGPQALTVGDFNGDAHPDLAIGMSQRVGIFRNDGIWPNRPVVHFYIYPAAGQVTAGQPFDVSVLALNALYGLVPNYTGAIGVFTTDPLGTPPFVYQFQTSDQGIASFLRGLTLRTPGQQLVYVYDTATFEVYGAAVFDVVGASPDRGGALDAHAVRALFANAAVLPPAESAERLPAAPALLPVADHRPASAPVPRAAPAPAAPIRAAWAPPLLDRLFAERYENVLTPPR